MFDIVNTVLMVEQLAQPRVPAVDRAVRILEALAADGERSLSELHRELGVSKSTLSSLLATLEQHRFVERDRSSRRFRLGPGLATIAMTAAAARVDVRDAMPRSSLEDEDVATAVAGVAPVDPAVQLEALTSDH